MEQLSLSPNVKSDMSVKTTDAVCEYHGAVQFYTTWDYVIYTDTTLLSFPTFLELPQLIRVDIMITLSVVNDEKPPSSCCY